MEDNLVKMSPKGQLVVPREIRAGEKFKPSDRFVAFGVKGGVLFRKVNLPNIRAEFESLSNEIANQFKARGLKEEDVGEAIKWARQKRR